MSDKAREILDCGHGYRLDGTDCSMCIIESQQREIASKDAKLDRLLSLLKQLDAMGGHGHFVHSLIEQAIKDCGGKS